MNHRVANGLFFVSPPFGWVSASVLKSGLVRFFRIFLGNRDRNRLLNEPAESKTGLDREKTGKMRSRPVATSCGKNRSKWLATYVDRYFSTNFDIFIAYSTTYKLNLDIIWKIVAFKLMYVVILQEYSSKIAFICEKITYFRQFSSKSHVFGCVLKVQ